ncbi:MAG: hypothetical protein LCI00_23950 [Chloroflexi bacterium]|nr:hypothetical protein [Chloroflexota bacterium]MCC6896111.1 hypothetical protein [Anaerolineae bacterium]
MQTKEAHAYDLFLEARALYTGKTSSEVRSEIDADEFEARIRALHYQYISGKFSFGRFTELAGVAHLELREILDALDLSTHH